MRSLFWLVLHPFVIVHKSKRMIFVIKEDNIEYLLIVFPLTRKVQVTLFRPSLKPFPLKTTENDSGK